MEDVWGDGDDFDEENFLNVESKNEFVNNDLQDVLTRIELELGTFAKENGKVFSKYVLMNKDGTYTYKNDAHVMFEVYCSVVDKIFEDHIKSRGSTRREFMDNLRELADTQGNDKYPVQAILAVDSFEKFSNFMLQSNRMSETATEDVAAMGF